MAKIGNEATLILKLAKERMERELTFKERNSNSTNIADQEFINGYRKCFTDYNDTLSKISLELERK